MLNHVSQLALGWGEIAPYLICLLALSAIAHAIVALRYAASRGRTAQLKTALDNMMEGLCMFDSEQRICLFNNRYAELYSLDPAKIKVGTTLREILDMRFAAGSSPNMTKDSYLKWRDNIAIESNPAQTTVDLCNGMTVMIRHRPMQGNGWVATHEDVTERLATERSRARMEERQSRRVGVEETIGEFRDASAALLMTFEEGFDRVRLAAQELALSSASTNDRVLKLLTLSKNAIGGAKRATLSAGELANSVSSIGSKIASATDLVISATSDTAEADKQISGLADAAVQIAQIVNAITEVADRTNLLALNATIEAARAGEAGRGFSVVAGEVKALSVQTQEATKQISSQINSVRSATEGAVSATHRNSDRMLLLKTQTADVSDLIEAQQRAADAIALEVETLAQTTEEVSSVLKGVEGAFADAANSATAVIKASKFADIAATDLREKLEVFLSSVAA